MNKLIRRGRKEVPVKPGQNFPGTGKHLKNKQTPAVNKEVPAWNNLTPGNNKLGVAETSLLPPAANTPRRYDKNGPENNCILLLTKLGGGYKYFQIKHLKKFLKEVFTQSSWQTVKTKKCDYESYRGSTNKLTGAFFPHGN